MVDAQKINQHEARADPATPMAAGSSLDPECAIGLRSLARNSAGPLHSEPVDMLQQLLALMIEVRDLLVTQRTVRDYYTTEQAAKVLGKANWTVREWCRLGRIHAEKRQSGRGRSQEWVISHAELLRIQREGLLPIPKYGL